MRSKITPEAHDVFRQLTPTEDYLKNLEKFNFNIFEPALFERDNLLALQLARKKWSKRF